MTQPEMIERVERLEQLLYDYVESAAESARIIAERMPSNRAISKAVDDLIDSVRRP